MNWSPRSASNRSEFSPSGIEDCRTDDLRKACHIITHFDSFFSFASFSRYANRRRIHLNFGYSSGCAQLCLTRLQTRWQEVRHAPRSSRASANPLPMHRIHDKSDDVLNPFKPLTGESQTQRILHTEKSDLVQHDGKTRTHVGTRLLFPRYAGEHARGLDRDATWAQMLKF